ncbi:SDR family NAD(P)-dependent oxidoreductase [Streptomyces sp. DSM 44917]|uniref:SDR family NAD(P)-dependent oxidoreductase n=1 Tax=Streptomyces boetiae TaxID=3075541 RepID=A0ABU2LFQ5_9ACTN|nr:SDR family NAD(P)-dependent oxidoreductase [Streptomyces sp. DSM 44917]MDT0310072.1 SDR family NAD(P)-dependent oxidoreductase [Streptomyces sp. DSM 44917]
MHETVERAPAAVVTGAGRGIGRAVAQALAARGYRLLLADLDGQAAERAAEAAGPGHLSAAADVADGAALRELAGAALAAFGRLDVWINNAGILPAGPLSSQTDPLLARTLATNVGGVLHGCRAALEVMLPRRSGHIVNVSSVCAVKPLAGLAVYSASKAAVAALSESLRRECRGRGVRVSAVLPYLTGTAAGAGLRPRLLRPLSPEDVARAVVATAEGPARARVFVPRRLGWALPWGGLLPDRARDAMDALLGMDRLALDADTGERAGYAAELGSLPPPPPRPGRPGEGGRG